jgi:hypothetical protein
MLCPNEPVEKVGQGILQPKWQNISGTRALCFFDLTLFSTRTHSFVGARGFFYRLNG